MKAPGIVFLIMFLFFPSILFSQEKVIKLNVEEGKTYVFGLGTTRTTFDKNNTPVVTNTDQITIEFKIEESTPDKIIFSSILTSGKSEKPDAKIKTINDIKFPPVVENINLINFTSNIIESLLTRVWMKYEIDLNTNSIKQINLAEMLEEMHSILTKKGNEKEIISDVIDFVTEGNETMQRILSYNELLLYFNRSVQVQNESIKSPYFEKVFKKTDNGNYVNGQNKKAHGNEFISMKLNNERGFVSNFYQAEYYQTNRYLALNEKEFKFLDEHKTGNNYFTFNCTIENPADSLVTFYYLDKPYGEDNTRKILQLDKNGCASFQTALPGRSFVYFSPKELDFRSNYAQYIFYAEPGDTINLKVVNSDNSSQLEISGNNEEINNLLNDLQKGRRFFLPSNRSVKVGSESTGFLGYSSADSAMEIFNKLIEERNVKLDKDDYDFISNELLATNYFNYFSYLNLYDFSSINEFEENRIEANEIKNRVDEFDIHDIYNDYGIYSRQLSNIYLHYYLRHLQRVNNSGYYNKFISEDFINAKLILSSSVFYQTMAGLIVNSITRERNFYSPFSKYDLNESLNCLDKLINQSYDEYYIHSLKEFRNKRLNWESEHFVPDVELYKPNGKKTTLENEIEGKPTIVYVSKDWSRNRYDLDKKAEENPDLRFVLIVQGNNLIEWQDYLKRAEPVAEQLLLIDNKKTLDDIFLRSVLLYIAFDKNGKLLGYDLDLKRAIRLAKQSLAPKKELDKSQLQTIVLILSILLISLIAGLIIWKWRVRQQFRKEEQQRRLRELELTAIRSQMNPHFLFNSLNSVQNLVQQNKGREAHLYLADFAGLIRKVLQNSEKEEVSLAEELEMTQHYLNLEKLRFDFEFQIEVPEDIDPHNTLVPSMLLQPFVENAIIHGLQHKSGNRQLKISISHERTGIKINITDNGIGRGAAGQLSKTKNGKGSKLMKERLEILQQKQGEKYHLETFDLNGKETGTRVEILIPEEM